MSFCFDLKGNRSTRELYDHGYRWYDIKRVYGMSDETCKLMEQWMKDGYTVDQLYDAMMENNEIVDASERIRNGDNMDYMVDTRMYIDTDKAFKLYEDCKTQEEYYSGADVDKPDIFNLCDSDYTQHDIIKDVLEQYKKEDVEAFFKRRPRVEFLINSIDDDDLPDDCPFLRYAFYEDGNNERILKEVAETDNIAYTEYGSFKVTPFKDILVFEYLDEDDGEEEYTPFTEDDEFEILMLDLETLVESEEMREECGDRTDKLDVSEVIARMNGGK